MIEKILNAVPEVPSSQMPSIKMVLKDPKASGLPPPPLTPRSILRSGQLAGTVRKRPDDESETPSTGETQLPDSSKRQRVTFSSDVAVHVLADMANTALETELVRDEVRAALIQKAVGNDPEYERIKAIFTGQSYSEDLSNPRLFENHILALSSNISLLGTSCNGLVQALLRFGWLSRDQSFVRMYIHFLGHLASSYAGYLPTILRMLVRNFKQVMLTNRPLRGYPAVKRKQMYTRVHTALRYLLQLIPSASGSLLSILASSLPNITDRKRQHVEFTQNMLKLASYASELNIGILNLITDQILKIDVHVQTEIDDLEDADLVEQLTENEPAGHRTLAPDDEYRVDSTESETSTDDDAMPDEVKQLKELKAYIAKMDALLDILFTHYEQNYSPDAPLEAQQAHFDFLLSQFQTTILPTLRARHTQFLLFTAAQASPDFIDSFLGVCIDIVFDSKRSSILKESAASYVASFVARAAFVTPEFLRLLFESLGQGLEQFAEGVDPVLQAPDKERFSTYYAIVQALLYIFCFRWRDLRVPLIAEEDDDESDEAEDSSEGILDDGLRWCPGVKETLEAACASRFNPLKICSSDIVAQFAKIAHSLNFLYVYPIIERNSRVHLFTSSSSQKSGHSGQSELEAYFPFDPYRLPMSKKWITDLYQEWQPIPEVD